MCGIAGYITINKSIKTEQLCKATSTIKHRGPDAEGFYFSPDDNVGLAHRRLSILDLSESANQPMISSDDRYVIVFNGEVYNFKELKSNLKDKGASLKTTSDTEVLLQLFAQEGVDSFRKLNGMFAFAIYDKESKMLTLCRDHAGIKPLFIYYNQSEIIFSSELKVINAIKGKDLTLNKKSIPLFLHLGFIPHPFTIYKEVSKFPAAHYLQIDCTQNNFNDITKNFFPFWSLEDQLAPQTFKYEGEARQILSDLLIDSVEKQLVSDVPIGTFLSGGVDSSLVTAIAAKRHTKKISSFSIAIDDGKYNESKYASLVAKNLGTDHHVFDVKEKEVMELINDFLPAYDEPFADSSALPTMMVSKMARKHVTVALSGDGGDELFMGYGAYNWAKTLNKKWIPFVKEPLHALSEFMSGKYKRAGNLFAFDDKENLKSHIFSQEQYFFSENELSDVLVDSGFDFKNQNYSHSQKRQLYPQEEQAIWDFKYYLPDDLLVKVDRASMQHSLEIRVPLLDYRIIEFAFNLDSDLKIKGSQMKYLLKEVLYEYLPKEIFERPKWGFSIPLKKWLKADLNFLVERFTCKSVIEKYSLLRFDKVQKIKKKYFDGDDYLFNRLWVIIVLHWWLEENFKSAND